LLGRCGIGTKVATKSAMFSKQRKIRLPQVRRRAGESLSEQRERRIYDKLPLIVCPPITFWLVYFTQQLQQWNHTGPQPQLWLWIAVIATVAAAIWFCRLIPIAQRLNRGEHGERHVADTLDELRRDGYRPIHDIVRDRFNIDHVLVGPAGVFAIETKFRSGHGEITFRNTEGVFLGDRLEEKDCLKQARANAKDISHFIDENCGRHEWVTPIVVFVGNWKIRNQWRGTNTQVCTPDGLLRYIRNQQPRLTRSEIELIVSHLQRSARA
jgi:Nuclease-related domain